MKGSIRIGTAFGIPIQLHWTFLALVFLAASTGIHPAIFLALFLCVLLHEIGHSLVARHFGIRVLDISFWPLGGMARMSDVPEDSRIEGLIAIAGPAVNFLLALLGTIPFFVANSLDKPLAAQLSLSFVFTNIALGAFNLIPAFPMDGGRVLRAWFGRKSDWVQATEKAVKVGRYVALGLFLLSVSMLFRYPEVFCMLPMISLFVWLAGSRELMGVRVRHGLPPFGIRFARATTGTPTGRDGGPGLFESGADEGTVIDVERDSAVPRTNSSGGFSEESIRALERFHGRLPRQAGED